MKLRLYLLIIILVITGVKVSATDRSKQNFNSGWLLHVGDLEDAWKADYDDGNWEKVTVPHAFNECEAFSKAIHELTDTVMWYRKHFEVDKEKDAKYFIEFEGIRQGGDCYVNGTLVGGSENGVMAFGFDITTYIKEGGNVIAFRIDNSWNYRDRKHDSRFQWNDKNFNANYGGIVKNVWLHTTGNVYQTLPLYSNLGTTGTYIYGSDYDIEGKKVRINAESEVRNESGKAKTLRLRAEVKDVDGVEVAVFEGDPITIEADSVGILKADYLMENAHFWSWGYGYLYTITTTLLDGKSKEGKDSVITRTGFRKTRFGDGKIWLNDRVMMVHGFAQRTSNEWPSVGIDVPAWISDYSNSLQVACGSNMVRWMHVTPSKQDIESCDRVGLPQAMPAGDAEKDVEGARWNQRTDLMRDAIIYNRNNPSIIFYESGNESISREHMMEMKAIRDKYDPNGGRAIGSREMLDIDEAEYGGEMLYINKSKKHPMWAMEYCRDEGLRKYWDEYSYPYHKEGDGPLYRGSPALEYNHNMDEFVKSQVKRWNEYYIERPGTGKRVSSGGVKIVFSDTNTHFRGEANYRTSGATDPMRIEKDAFYAFQTMWDGWVEPEQHHTYIVGHWNYPDSTTKKPVYVVSTGEKVELKLNGKSLGYGKRDDTFLFTFDQVEYEPGKLEAISYDADGKELSRSGKETVGEAKELKLSVIENPEGFKADGSDLAIIQVEVVDGEGRRCPLDNRMVSFSLDGEGEWRGGIALRSDSSLVKSSDGRKGGDILDSSDAKNISDNYILSKTLPVECGINRVFVRSTTTPGNITLTAKADGLKDATISLETQKPKANERPSLSLACNLSRGETPSTPSYSDIKREIEVEKAEAGANKDKAYKSFDDNELSQWESDGNRDNAWISYTLSEKAAIDEITLKLTGWRNKCYPLEIYADGQMVWEGITGATLGYYHINIENPIEAETYTIKMTGPTMDSNAFGAVKELAGGNTGELDRVKMAKGEVKLRIVEADFLLDNKR